MACQGKARTKTTEVDAWWYLDYSLQVGMRSCGKRRHKEGVDNVGVQPCHHDLSSATSFHKLARTSAAQQAASSSAGNAGDPQPALHLPITLFRQQVDHDASLQQSTEQHH